MSRAFSFFDSTTGMFHAMTLHTDVHDPVQNAAFIEANTPPGHVAIPGSYDAARQRVDVATGAVVDYKPPQPSADHDWDIDRRHWVLNPDAQKKIDADVIARMTIAALERSQHRVIREMNLGDPAAKLRLANIDEQIASLRKDILP